MIIKITIIVNTVIIGNKDIYNLGIFEEPATRHIKSRHKLKANQAKVYIVKN